MSRFKPCPQAIELHRKRIEMSKNAARKRFEEKKLKVEADIAIECYERYMCNYQSYTAIAHDMGLGSPSMARRFVLTAAEIIEGLIQQDVEVVRQKAINRNRIRIRELEDMIDNYNEGEIITLKGDKVIKTNNETCIDGDYLKLAVHDRIVKYEQLLMQLEGTKKQNNDDSDIIDATFTHETALKQLQ